jgi:FtsP/CotA-like multicopper oxidase with cupredoxin domain
MKHSVWAIVVVLCVAPYSHMLRAEATAKNVCPRPQAGSTVAEPEDLRSQNGVLEVHLTANYAADVSGSKRYCYSDAAGRESPNLRVNPGDLVILHLTNALSDLGPQSTEVTHPHSHLHPQMNNGACTSGIISPVSTNLHFHGMTIPPVCHQDDVLITSVQPGDAPFEYRFRVPENEPPGLYWYHPHIHGFSKQQLLGGASGALIVEGIERAKKAAAGLPERVFIIRDQDLINPDALPSKSEPVATRKPAMRDADGDMVNSGNGFGKTGERLVDQLRARSFPGLPSRSDRDEARRTAVMARAECFGLHLSQAHGPVSGLAPNFGARGH